MSSITYRKEIDGLRALAIIPVVLFHSGIMIFSGGYIGVDIFFVISGYLITSIIYNDILNKSFSYKQFWLRRTRRILPASMIMVMVSLIIFSFIYPVNLYHDFIKSVIANSFFSSNILFWSEGGYFASKQELKPLLHTWSLSIEEQFYIFFPMLLIILLKINKNIIFISLLIICFLSLLLSVYASKFYSTAAFYLLPTRVWELGTGALIAIYFTTKKDFPFINGKLLQYFGFFCILLSIFIYDNHTPFPSFYALLPVIGTACIILSKSTNSLIYIILSSKILVNIGLISYSVYLWHWPIMVIKNWLFRHQDLWYIDLFSILLSFILGYISYKLIETPTRNKNNFSDKAIVKLVSIFSLGLLFISTLLFIKGNSFIVDPNNILHPQYLKAVEPEPLRQTCTDLYKKNIGNKVSCKILSRKNDNKIDIFLWGDSHAGAMLPAFYKMAKKGNLNIEFSINHGCQPIIEMKRVDIYLACSQSSDATMKYIEKHNFPIVLLISSFTNNIIKGRFRETNSDNKIDLESTLHEFSNKLNKTIQIIKKTNAKVVVFTEPPRFPVSPIFEEQRAKTLGITASIPTVTLTMHNNRINKVYSIIDQAKIDLRLNYSTIFCPDDVCIYKKNNQYLYKDSSHISNFTAELLAPYILKDLNENHIIN